MKKQRSVLYFLVCFSIISCAVTPKVKQIFDESIPLEKTTRISAGNAGEIIGYNGIVVSWKNEGSIVPTMIQIPAGDTLLEWNVQSRNGNIIYSGKNLLFRFNFQAQKQYIFLASRVDGKEGFKVYVYDFEEKIPSNMYKDEYFVGHVQFLDSPWGE